MKYFKSEITYELDSGMEEAVQSSQTLYCCTSSDFPKSEELLELFYSLDGHGKKYQSATWKQVRGEDIPTDEIHLL